MAERIFEIASCRSVTHGVAWLKRSYQTLLRRAGCSRVSCLRARSSDPSCWISCSRKPLALINPQLSRSAIHMASFMSRLAAGNVLDRRRIGHWPASVRTCRRSAYSTPTSDRPRSFHRHMGTQYTRSPLATGMIRAQRLCRPFGFSGAVQDTGVKLQNGLFRTKERPTSVPTAVKLYMPDTQRQNRFMPGGSARGR
jgi:hypothetical protein